MEDHREARRQHRGISGNSDGEKEEKMKIEAEEFSTLFQQRDPT
jgi:hypothetical protein